MIPTQNAENLEHRQQNQTMKSEMSSKYHDQASNVKSKGYHSPPFSPAQTPQKTVPRNEESDIFTDQTYRDHNALDGNSNQGRREFQSAALNHAPIRRENDVSGLTDQFLSTGGQNNKKQNSQIIREKMKQRRVQAHQSNFNSISQASNDNNHRGISFYHDQSNASNAKMTDAAQHSIDNSSFAGSQQFTKNQSPFQVQDWSHKKSAIANVNNQNGQPEGYNGIPQMPTVIATPYTKQLPSRYSTTTGKNINSEDAYVSRQFLSGMNTQAGYEDQEMTNVASHHQSSSKEPKVQSEGKENCNLNSNSDKDKRKIIHKLIEQQKRGLSSSRATQKLKIKQNGQINLIHKKLTGHNQQQTLGQSPSFIVKSGGTKLDLSKGLNRAANLSTTIQPKVLNFGAKNSGKKNSPSIENFAKNITISKSLGKGLNLKPEICQNFRSMNKTQNGETPQKQMSRQEVEPPKIMNFMQNFDPNMHVKSQTTNNFSPKEESHQDSNINIFNNLGLGESSVENTNAHNLKNKFKGGQEVENEILNEQTINSVTVKSNESQKQFVKEREYDQAQLDIGLDGVKDPQQLAGALNMCKQISTGSDALMRINSGTFNSLGKRTWSEFEKASKQSPDTKKNKELELSRIDEDDVVKERVRRTPARKIKRLRRNSDNFCVEQDLQSGKKLINHDESDPLNEISPHEVGKISQLFKGIPSDIPMSSYDQLDNSNNDNSHSNIHFQKMNYTGHNHHMAINKIQQQLSGKGSSFDNYTNNDNSELNCQACLQDKVMQNQRGVVPMQPSFPLQGNPSIPVTNKETPVFNFKQLDGSAVLRQLTAQKDVKDEKKPFDYHLQFEKIARKNDEYGHLTLYQQQNGNNDTTKNHEVVSEESEEGQFERDGDFINNEDPSTNAQTQGGTREIESKKKVETRQTFNNYGQVYFNQNMQTMRQSANDQFMMPLQKQFQIIQQQQLANQQPNVIRQLSFTSNSGASSSINTPIQKRIKVGSNNNSNAQQNRLQNILPQNLDQQMTTAVQPALQKSFTTKEGSPQSVISRWRQSDPNLMNKYRSGFSPPQKRVSLNPDNRMFFQDDCVDKKSSSLYFKKPGNNTMQSDQAQAQMLILSPNEQQALNSDNYIEDRMPEVQHRRFQIDQTARRESFLYQPTNEVSKLKLKKMEKSHSTTCEQNLFVQTIPTEHNFNFFQSLAPQDQINHKSASDLQRQMSYQNTSQVLCQNVIAPLQNNRGNEMQIISNEPFLEGPQNNNFFNQMNKTQSSQCNTLSQHTCKQKHLNLNPINTEGRSTGGGPKTPVHLKDRNSYVSGTNTSMNQQSCSMDTDNQDYQGKYSKNKRSKYQNFGGVNPGTVSAFQPGMAASISSLQAMKPPAVSLFQQSANRGSNSLFSGKSNSNQMNSNHFQPKVSIQTNQQPFQLASTPKSKISWLEKEFTIINIVGRGHFGEVLKCRNNTDQFEYAIKVTNTRISNPSEQAQCLQEMQTISALSVKSECPHIVRYFNSWMEQDRIHIVMELCQKSLGQVKKEAKQRKKQIQQQIQQQKMSFQDLQSTEYKYEGYIPEEELIKIIRDLLLGLYELHGQDIVHLDIKPGNILLGKNNMYKLADLGMARFLTKITDDTNIPEGDSRYLAKELLSRDVLNQIPDLKKSDIFSLGITVYELLTLSNLEKNGHEWRALRDGSFEYPQNIEQLYSEKLLNTIRRMLAENTDDRPTADYLLQNVFQSPEQRQIQALQNENKVLKFNQQKLLDFMQQNGYNTQSILQSLQIDQL